MSILFENFRLPGNQRKPGELYLTVQKDKIVDLSIYPPLNNNENRIDCNGCYLSPGLVDLQLYGAGGMIFSESFSETDFIKIDQLHLRAGTTRYLMTVPSLSHEDILKAIAVTKEIMSRKNTGCLGLHLEGPWLNPTQRGGHDPAIIRRPDQKNLEAILAAGKGIIKLITIAPEQFNPKDLAWLLNTGIPVSAGHSDATAEEARQFFDQGIRLSTHLYNAMSGMHHRSPGLTGATLLDDRVFSTIIADGIHVDYSMIALSCRIKQERLLLISDATFFGVKEENILFHQQKITNKDGVYRSPEGRLMGSGIALLQAVQNMVRYVQIPIPEALKMASTYPSRFLGDIAHGQLAKGKVADILLLDGQLNLQRIFRAGKEL